MTGDLKGKVRSDVDYKFQALQPAIYRPRLGACTLLEAGCTIYSDQTNCTSIDHEQPAADKINKFTPVLSHRTIAAMLTLLIGQNNVIMTFCITSRDQG